MTDRKHSVNWPVLTKPRFEQLDFILTCDDVVLLLENAWEIEAAGDSVHGELKAGKDGIHFYLSW
jgi:hypothetical protein